MFLVAGYDRDFDKVKFFAGSNMAHRKDRSAVLSANRAAAEILKREGISNLKLQIYGIAHFCVQCGVNFRKFYGEDGGALRDDDYVHELRHGT